LASLDHLSATKRAMAIILNFKGLINTL